MKKIVKSAACIALLLTLLLSLVGCGDTSAYPPVASTAPDSTTLVKWGDYEMKYELFRFFFLNSLSDYDGGDHTRWRGEEGDALWETAVEEILYRICDLYATLEVAKEYGIDPNSKELLAKVDAYIQADVEGGWIAGKWIEGYGSHEAYLEAIERDYHATDAVMRLLYQNTVVLNALYDYIVNKYGSGELMVTDDLLNALMDSETCVRYNQVFIPFDLRGEAWARERAAAIRADMLSATDYEELIRVGFAKSGDIPTQHTLENGMWASAYTIDRYLSTTYYNALFSLGEGEISEIVETEDGCYILYGMQKPLDASSDAAVREDLIQLYLSHSYYLRIHEMALSIREELTYTDEYARVRGVTFLDDKRA
jgi:hypothetical protein